MVVNVLGLFEDEIPEERRPKVICIGKDNNPFSDNLFKKVLLEYRDRGVPALTVPVSEFIADISSKGRKIGPFKVDTICFRRQPLGTSHEDCIKRGIDGLVNEAKRRNAVAVTSCEFSVQGLGKNGYSSDPKLEFYGRLVIPLYKAGIQKSGKVFCR